MLIIQIPIGIPTPTLRIWAGVYMWNLNILCILLSKELTNITTWFNVRWYYQTLWNHCIFFFLEYDLADSIPLLFMHQGKSNVRRISLCFLNSTIELSLISFATLVCITPYWILRAMILLYDKRNEPILVSLIESYAMKEIT